MSLFSPEADAGPADLGARRNAYLPSPTKTRFEPLRAGILNVWEYDDQQFWFGDGRLLLRGRNEAGKSKVLELLFPFVLDGDITPKKLDPFDTANKSMWWNMIGFSTERKSAIGYLWIEYGRIDGTGQAEYLTAIVGVQATAAERKVSTWFAVTPQRIDADLDLAPGRVCRTIDSFQEALSADAKFATKSSVHRANVAGRLFAMSPERFDNLLHLLRQLRKPKLADKLDPKKLSAVLTDALPPLDEHRIKPLADGFGFLDADIEELARTEIAFRATSAFLDVYRSYAQTHVRHRADVVRAAITRFDDVTRAAVDAQNRLDTARQEHTRLTKESVRLERQYAEATGNLQGLDLSAVDSLRSLEQAANADAEIVATIAGESKRAKKAATDADAEAARCEAEATGLRAKLDQALGSTRAAADKAQVPGGWEADDHTVSASQLTSAIASRRSLVDAVDAADRRAAAARRDLDLVADRLKAAGAAQEAAADDLEAAKAGQVQAEVEFIAAVDAWCGQAPAQQPFVDGGDLAEELADAVAAGNASGRAVAVRAAGPATTSATEAVRAATVAEAEARRVRTAATAALEVHDALPTDPPPPRRAGIAETRGGTPLWLAVDFTDDMTSEEAAMLEAALESSGLLDAVITKKGLETLDGDDTVLIAPRTDLVGLAAWLQPAEGADQGLAARAISAIAAGADTGAGCWVDLDGAWANGALTGRWSKPTAEYIGATARAAARTRRRGELVEDVELATEAHTAAADDLTKATAHAAAVDAWVDGFPSLAGWTRAAHDLRTATKAADRADGTYRKAEAAHTKEAAKVAGLLEAVDLAVEAADCQPADVPGHRTRLEAAADRARDLLDAAREHHRSHNAAETAADTAARLAGNAADAAERLEQARLKATGSKAKYDKAVEVEGADVEAILAEKQRLEQSIEGLQQCRQAVNTDKQGARDTEVRAEEVLRETQQRRDDETTKRDTALEALAAVARTGHVTLALGVDAGRDPSEYMQPTAGRNLARQIANAVSDNQATEAARAAATDRILAEFTRLRDDIAADFDPHLDTVETILAASATLNGEVIEIAGLYRALAEDVEQRRAAIAAEERNLIEQHLRDEVGNHLGERLHDATVQVRQMNDTLKRHPTNSGTTVHLSWSVDDEAGPSVVDATKALLTSPATRTEQASAILATFLGERVALARRGDIEGADLAERLTAALDYRRWYRFKLKYNTAAGQSALTSKTVGTGSGGQQAKISHLPLLAAAAGFYSSSPSAPRMCILDEAFAGIDGPNTADLLAVSVALDLDMVMTNYDAWFCIPELPGLAIYHLEKLPETLGVAAIRYTWNGTERGEQDPWLDE